MLLDIPVQQTDNNAQISSWIDASLPYFLQTKVRHSAFDYGQGALLALENPHSGVIPSKVALARQTVSRSHRLDLVLRSLILHLQVAWVIFGNIPTFLLDMQSQVGYGGSLSIPQRPTNRTHAEALFQGFVYNGMIEGPKEGMQRYAEKHKAWYKKRRIDGSNWTEASMSADATNPSKYVDVTPYLSWYDMDTPLMQFKDRYDQAHALAKTTVSEWREQGYIAIKPTWNNYKNMAFLYFARGHLPWHRTVNRHFDVDTLQWYI